MICIDSQKDKTRLLNLLYKMETLISVVSSDSLTSSVVSKKNADLLIVAKSLLPIPASSFIDGLRHLHEKPDLVILRDSEDVREQEQYLAMGVLAVINTSITDKELTKILELL